LYSVTILFLFCSYIVMENSKYSLFNTGIMYLIIPIGTYNRPRELGIGNL